MKLRSVTNRDRLIKDYDESKFAIDYVNSLNPAQYEAARAEDGSYLIIAGAGSGKTRTLVYRVARLIEIGYDPTSILLLTFTRKAANEMMHRAEILLDKRCSKIQGGTFHSYANAILRRYAVAAHLEPNFTILDQGDSEDVVNLIRSESPAVEEKTRFPNKQTLFKIFSLSANTGRPVDEIVDEEYPHFSKLLDRIVQIQSEYTIYKKINNLLDFDDLLITLRDFFFEYSPTAKRILDSINFIMVDEYQDTNRLQAELVEALTQTNKNIMVVGDDLQSIYSFRGASFKNIMQFPELFPGTTLIKLEENYRSTPQILTFANKVQDAAIWKYEKSLYSFRPDGELPYIIASENENMQSRFIVQKILELREEGVPLTDIAVLFRSSFFSFDLEIELTKANIPFVKIGGIKFVEAAHIKDILAFLRVLLNPLDLVSWYRILMMHPGIGPKTARKILDEISSGKATITKETSECANSIFATKCLKLLTAMRKIFVKEGTPTEKAQLVVNYYMPLFRDLYDDFNKRSKDIDTLLNITEKYTKLEEFLSDMAIEPPLDSISDLENPDKEDEKLTLSTIHSAKGLEWHSVFIMHAIDGFFPSIRSIETAEGLEEERRLMYVAATRAKQNLFISYPMKVFDREMGVTFSKPSRFLSNISPDIAEGYLLEE
ncbi:MAG: ATP-dependent helicase [Ignavibacteriaceae bacterium]|nr:MAG: ATP-dependent helicase [Ignavibacteriaceae bacterium]MBW7872239.1 ATP-dependent helicase [Ignavibacteria bacterium]MBZ0195822.1 ATP-dependent helicase [Ignavibacteriaceae bacterium]OQY75928.1 MAG: ATP-dependent DNA helicase [Ignavibacteriales bacterium UTCHB3]